MLPSSRLVPPIAVLLLGLGATGCAVDRYDVAYPDVFAARAEDAVDRGWVPDWLPEGATDIRTAFDPAAGGSILVATLGDDRASLDEACDPADVVEPPTLEAAWFDADAVTSAAVQSCDDGRLVVVDGDDLATWTPAGVVPSEPEE